jgi:uncharacterized protein YeaO (DUF488 family)
VRRNNSAFELRIKRIYEPPAANDGARVLVDRLWPRGIRKQDAAVTLWLKEIAPSPELRKWFNHDPVRLQEFGRRYRAELGHNSAVDQLEELLINGPVTLLYAARDPACNHARVLADYLTRHFRGDDHLPTG